MGPFEKAKQLYDRAIEKRTNKQDLDIVIGWKEEELSILFSCTDLVRRHFYGNRVKACAIMNIKSGGCSEDCGFCSQSVHNRVYIAVTKLPTKDEIIGKYKFARAHNLSFGVVSSGRRLSSREITKVVDALRECGREVNLGRLQSLMFYAGANGYISGDYLTTKGDKIESDDELIKALNLEKSSTP